MTVLCLQSFFSKTVHHHQCIKLSEIKYTPCTVQYVWTQFKNNFFLFNFFIRIIEAAISIEIKWKKNEERRTKYTQRTFFAYWNWFYELFLNVVYTQSVLNYFDVYFTLKQILTWMNCISQYIINALCKYLIVLRTYAFIKIKQ